MSIVWGVELRDSVSLPANAAASAMGTAAQRAKALESAMKSTQSAMTQAQALGDVIGVRKSAAAYHQFGEELQKVRAQLAPLEAAQAAETSRLAAMKAEAAVAAAAMLEEAEAAEASAKAVASAAAWTAAAVAASVVAIGAALYEGSRVALDASENVKRLTSTFDALGEDGAHAGAATLSMLRDLEKQVPQNEATLSSWARTLEGAGMTDLGQLRQALTATAAAEALVEGGGEKVKNVLAKLNEQSMKGGGKVKFLLAQLAGTGVTEPEFLRALGMTPEHFAAAKKAGSLTGKEVNDAIVKALATKATGPLAAQMNQLSTIESKAADGAKRLFEDVDPGPFTDGVKSFFSVFDEANPSGQVLKATLTAAFNAVFRIAGRVLEFVRRGFLHLTILALQLAIAIKTHKTVFEAVAAVLTGVALGAVVAITVAMWGFVASAASAAVAVVAATWPFLLIGAAIGLVIFGIYELVKHWDEVKAFFVGMAKGAWDAATGFVDGLVNGIKSGIGRVVDAATGLGKAAWSSVKNFLGIHSPSTMMFQLGAHTASGYAGGMEAGHGDVQDAGVGMSAAASSGASRRVGAPSSSGGGGNSFTFGDITLQLGGTAMPASAELRGVVEEGLASLAERLALMVGSAPDPA